MRSTPFGVALVVWTGLGLASVGAAQTVIGPTIHNVTLNEGAGVLTITGIGLGADMLVTIDGQPVTVMQGGTDTRIDVFAPAALLTTPGTYRLTVVDPVRRVGDAFVVATQPATVALSRAAPTATGTAPTAGHANGLAVTTVPQFGAGPLTLSVIEDSGSPFRTAVGYQALFANTTGEKNSASGYQALYTNTTGLENTASGYQALYGNTTGLANTASGHLALYANTQGQNNTASGQSALYSNITGLANTASGAQTLYSNTTGYQNTGSGATALYSNTWGSYNTASGFAALFSNTEGTNNTASGFNALRSNTTGWDNTASGVEALFGNTTGLKNVGLGIRAGRDATSGTYNLFLGAEVRGKFDDTNTIRIGKPYLAGTGQNKTFIAGIRGTAVSGGLPVVVDAEGKMGTAGGTAPLSLLDDTNTQPYQIRLGHLNGVADYGIGRNPSDGVLDFTATQSTFSGFRFNTPNAGTVLAIANNGEVSMMDATNSRPYQLRLGFLNGFADYGIGRNPSDGYLTFAATQDTYSGYRFNTPNAGTGVTIANDGAVGIGVTAPSQPLQLASGAYVSAGGVWTNASSRTLKDLIAPLSTADAIQAVADLSPVTFVYKAAPGEAHVGFIAEDVPGLVATQDRRSLATMDLLAVVTKVVQVQQQQLREQDATMVELRTRLARLEALLAREQ